jgi:hypothetical protein
MAQHDYAIENAPGSTVRADMNNAFSAISSLNSGATEPSTKFAYMWWIDTTTGVLKRRNGANTGWTLVHTLSNVYVNKTSDFTAGVADVGRYFYCTSAVSNIDFVTSSSLSADWFCTIKNATNGTITLDPFSSQTMNGLSTVSLLKGQTAFVFTDGSNLFASITFADTASASIIGVGPTQQVVVATGGVAWWTIPQKLNGMNLIRAYGNTVTAGSGSTMTVQVRNTTLGQDMLSAPLTWASASKTSNGSETINTTYDHIATNDVIRIDVDSIHTTGAYGLEVTLEFERP